MALTNTLGTYYLPFRDRYNAITPHYVEVRQTSVSGSTSGTYKIVSSQTADNMYLFNLNITVLDATSTSQVLIMMGTHTLGALPAAGATSPSAALGTHNFNFSTFGIMGPDTALTNAVSLNIVNATSTVLVNCVFGIGQ